MGLRDTEESTGLILERMENSLVSLEQMSLDSINITDSLVAGIDEVRQCVANLRVCGEMDREYILDMMQKLLQELLNTAFAINNVSHELEKETVYQRDTLQNIRQILELLYSMTDIL